MKRWLQKIDRFLSLDPEKTGKLHSLLIYQVRFYIQISKQLVRDNCLQQAAALAFNTLLSLVPIVALLFSMFRSFANLQKYESYVQEFLQRHLLAESAAEAFVKIKEFSQNISSLNNALSVLFLLLFSLGLFNTIEATINAIWKVKKSRSIFERFITYWILVTLGPLLIVASLQLSARLSHIAYVGTFLKTLFTVFPMTFIVLALTFTYKLVPNTRVKWNAAITGGIVAGILFELAKRGFNLYVTRIDYYNNIYLSLTTLVFFLLWVYVAWVIVLFGTEISFTLQNLSVLYRRDREISMGLTNDQAVFNDIFAVRVFWYIASVFTQEREPATRLELAEHFNLSPQLAEEIIRRLEEENLVVRTSNPAEGIVPARALHTIPLTEIFTRFRVDFPLSNPEPALAEDHIIDGLISQMEAARLQKIEDLSVADLCKSNVQ